MTIAACYLSTEGVVFGADSTTTITTPNQAVSQRYYDYAQKIFQVGEPSTLGIVMWGMGSLPGRSHRTMIAQYADALRAEERRAGMVAVAERWAGFFWEEYTKAIPDTVARARELHNKFDKKELDEDGAKEFFQIIQDYSGGFCLGGNLEHARTPQAFEVVYQPWFPKPPAPVPVVLGQAKFWGCPNLIERVLYGIDMQLLDKIEQSEHWKGTRDQLYEMVSPHILHQQALLPIREAIDWVYASIYCTIKSMKYSQLDRVCGGPIEIAIVTSDRPFRWVRHKQLGAAIKEGSTHDGLHSPAN